MELIFDAYRIDTDRFELADAAGRVEVEPQVLELLIFLIRNRGRLVGKDELHQEFWQDRFVSDSALSSLVRAARQAVGDNGRDQRLIETQHGRGFRFLGSVTELGGPAPEIPPLTSAPVGPGPVIAVLPFDNFSGRPENDVIADGIVEEITTGLCRFRWFTVIARNSVFALRERPTDLRRIGAELGADYLVEGSINREDDRVRVHVQLIEVASGGHVWAGRFDLEFESLFSLLDRITTQVVGALEPQLLDSEERRAARAAPSDRTAWQLFVQAQRLLMMQGREANAEARVLLHQALAREPGAARVHASIALSHLWDVAFGWSDDRTASMVAAHDAATRAVALDASDSWAWTTLGACKLFYRHHSAAIADIRRAIALDPSSALAHGVLALVHGFAGEPEAALASVGAARRLSPSDPREPIWLNAEGIALFALGRHEEALEAARRMTELRPDYPTGHRLVAASAAALGLDEAARAAVARLLDLMPGHRLEHVPALMPFLDLSVAAPYLRALARAGLPGDIPAGVAGV
jgi:TolB-like protein/Flp pilus assembly protein TadD